MRIVTRLAVVVLVIAAASALWWLDTLRERPVPEVAPEARHEPDFYFNDFRLRAYERPEPPVYVLEGERLVHFADDGSGAVTRPRLRYGGNGGAPWHIAGRYGVVHPGGGIVEIDEQVVMRREPGNRAPVTVRTAHMTVFTTAGRAHTDRPVTVRSPGWRIAAVGMTARFDPGLIELHANVRGRYDPAMAP